MMPEPLRVHRHTSLLPPLHNELVDPRRRQRSPPARAQPQVRPSRQRMINPHAQVPIQALGGLGGERDDPGLATLAKDLDLPPVQVQVTARSCISAVGVESWPRCCYLFFSAWRNSRQTYSRTASAGRCAGVAGSAIFLPEISLYRVPMRSLEMAMARVPGSGAQSL